MKKTVVAALVIGRAGSTGFKNKNLHKIKGRPLMHYSILAALNSKKIDVVYFSSDSEQMIQEAKKMGVETIDRPQELATKAALAEDAFQHGYFEIKKRLGCEIEIFVPLFANGATITPGILDEGIDFLRKNKDYDSAVTVSEYNMFSPLRAKKIEDGLVKPFVDLDQFENATCDRSSQGDCFFVDCSGFVVRSQCMEDFSYGLPPFRWIGKKVYPLMQWGGIDVDYEWQLGQLSFWLEKHGFTEDETPYDTL